MKAMGTHYLDAGQLRVVNVQPKVAIAQVTLSCDYMQRGDIVLPFQERPSPTFKDPGAFDHFAPVSGKPVAMVVQSKDYQQSAGRGSAVYVNLGTEKGVRVGDYFRVFRYEGSLAELAPQTKGFQDRLYGFGSSPGRYKWNDLPREVLGEGIVINVSRNSSTVLITYNSIEIYTGTTSKSNRTTRETETSGPREIILARAFYLASARFRTRMSWRSSFTADGCSAFLFHFREDLANKSKNLSLRILPGLCMQARFAAGFFKKLFAAELVLDGNLRKQKPAL